MIHQPERKTLSPHFSRWEFTLSNTAVRLGLENTPNAIQWLALESLCREILEPCREAVGPLHVTSGYRSQALNHAVGGAHESQHMKGEAVDIVPHQGSLSDLFRWLYFSKLPFDQLIWEFSSWIHVSHSHIGEPRGEVFGYHMVNGAKKIFPIGAEQVGML